MEKGINLVIKDGDEFFSHETSVHFTPLQFIFDFKCVTPRIDPRGKDKPTFHMRHNVVMLDPYHAKQMINILHAAVENYEKKFGKINKPKAISKLEKKSKSKKAVKKDKKVVPNYLG